MDLVREEKRKRYVAPRLELLDFSEYMYTDIIGSSDPGLGMGDEDIDWE